jgi:hypothetical protein
MSIIALSGYAGSGKDLVGQFIQLFNCPPDILKATKIDKLSPVDDWWLEERSGYEIKKFAGKLKIITSILTGIPLEKLEDQEFKKTTLGSDWDFADADAPDNMMTVRMFLQKLGTDALRNGLHENVWVNALMADYTIDMSGYSDRMTKKDLDDLYPNWIITDCRFPNEAKAIKDRGGIIIRVNRPGITAVNAHPSETSLDDWDFDEVINNNGSKEQLFKKVCSIIEKTTTCLQQD